MPIESEHPEYRENSPRWKKCDDIYQGSFAVKANGETYLPKPSGLEKGEYEAYVKRALFLNATGRTVDGLSGMIINSTHDLKVPDNFDYLKENMDGQNTNSKKAIRLYSEELLKTGKFGIFLDRSVDGSGPYLVLYPALTITNWNHDDNGDLDLVVLMESYTFQDPDDSYKITQAIQFRELFMEEGVFHVRLWRKEDPGDSNGKFQIVPNSLVTPSNNSQTIDFIPFYIANLSDDKIPIEDLCDVNISHYHNSADIEHGRHLTALPTPWAAGSGLEGKLSIGSSTFIKMGDPSAKIGYLEFTGSGLNALKDGMAEKERQMAILGARLLETQKQTAETAETARLHKLSDVSILTRVANQIETTLNEILNQIEQWTGASDMLFTINSDFIDETISPQEITALLSARIQGEISQETFLSRMKDGGILGDDVTVEDEIDRLKEEGENTEQTPPTTPGDGQQLENNATEEQQAQE